MEVCRGLEIPQPFDDGFEWFASWVGASEGREALDELRDNQISFVGVCIVQVSNQNVHQLHMLV